jgi:hypothetical protein
MSRFDFRSWTRTLDIVCLFVLFPIFSPEHTQLAREVSRAFSVVSTPARQDPHSAPDHLDNAFEEQCFAATYLYSHNSRGT